MFNRYFFFILFLQFFLFPFFCANYPDASFWKRLATKYKYKPTKYKPTKYKPVQLELTEYKPSEYESISYEPTNFELTKYIPAKYKPSIKIPIVKNKRSKRFYTKTNFSFRENWVEWFKRRLFGKKKID